MHVASAGVDYYYSRLLRGRGYMHVTILRTAIIILCNNQYAHAIPCYMHVTIL